MNAVPKAQARVASAAAPPFAVEVADGVNFSSYRVTPIKHSFHEHPLMELPRLAELAKVLYKTQQCRFILPGITQASAFDHHAVSPDGRDIEDVFRRLDESGSWLALYNIETDPTYAAFLNEVVDSARHLLDARQSEIFKVAGFMFLSAPPSVTPFHIDRENNLWLQMHGRKIINVWNHTDREVVPGKHVDEFIVSGTLEHVRLKDGFRERSHECDVGPGDGVYFPATSPHMTRTTTDWVRPGNGISISLGVVFYTRHTYYEANIHACNLLLRRFGMSPRSPGANRFVDALKFACGRTHVWIRKTFRGYRPSNGLRMP
jgi:hypothetical protein